MLRRPPHLIYSRGVMTPIRPRLRGKPPEIQLLQGAAEKLPLHVRLYRTLREHILAGALCPGDRLPSSRILARDLKLSRNTVESAVGQLVAEGYVVRRVGVGTVVADSLAEAAPFAKKRPSIVKPQPAVGTRLSRRGQVIAELGQAEIDSDSGTGTWATNAPGFPWQAWNRILARQARRAGSTLLGPVPLAGHDALREQIAEYASLARGLKCHASQVVVVSSAQQGIDLAARVLLDPGQEAFLEDPCYPSARAALAAAGAVLKGVPVDQEGMIVEQLPADASRSLIYVTPSHQFPLGMTLSLQRRLALLNWAASTESLILEDDYDSEFRYDSRPLAALHALDEDQRVLYVGTFNKILFPGLRLAYLIVPLGLAKVFAAARRITDGSSSPLIQLVLAEFMTSGQFAVYLRNARSFFGECRSALVTSIQRSWGAGVTIGPASTGLHLTVHLPAHVDDRALAQVKLAGLGIAPLSRYFLEKTTQRGLMLSYGWATPSTIAASVERLAPLIRDALARTS